MRPAVEPFKEALKNVDIVDPIIPVLSNVDGKSYRNAHHIRRQLPTQIYKPVKWEQTLHILYERKDGEYFPRTFECGPGNSLKSLLKMVNAKAWSSCISVEAQNETLVFDLEKCVLYRSKSMLYRMQLNTHVKKGKGVL